MKKNNNIRNKLLVITCYCMFIHIGFSYSQNELLNNAIKNREYTKIFVLDSNNSFSTTMIYKVSAEFRIKEEDIIKYKKELFLLSDDDELRKVEFNNKMTGMKNSSDRLSVGYLQFHKGYEVEGAGLSFEFNQHKYIIAVYIPNQLRFSNIIEWDNKNYL